MRIVRENTLQLQKLIEDLLNYHQTRAMEPQTLGPVPLADVIRRVVREHKLAALARMITFEAKLKPAIVVGDAEKIRTIVDNLISNAIKYSPRSGLDRDPPRTSTATSPCSTSSTRGRASIRRSGSASSNRSIRASLRPRAGSRDRGSVLRSRASTRWRMAAGSRCSTAPDGKRGAHFRLWLPLADGRRGSARPQPARSISIQEEG